MLVRELKEKLKDIPDEAFVYLDDRVMLTCLGLVSVEFIINDGFVVETREPIKIPTVILSTYKWGKDES